MNHPLPFFTHPCITLKMRMVVVIMMVFCRFDVLQWDTFNSTHIFLPDDFHNTMPLIGVDLQDVMVSVLCVVVYVPSFICLVMMYKM